MQAAVEIGENLHFTLRKALLVYGSGQKSFITQHDISTGRKGSTSVIGPAQTLTQDFVNSLIESVVGGSSDAEVLPENVLAKGSRSVAWWTRAQRRQMFFTNAEGKGKKLNGKIFPHPPLVWVVSSHTLFVRALAENKRPVGGTELAVAPYWNVSDDGRVCLGSMRDPGSTAVSSIEDWERGFYESAFTHSNIGRSTRHAEGFEGLWGSLMGKRCLFPNNMLIPLPQTLAQFLREARV
jgi:PRTRC genetic system protein B